MAIGGRSFGSTGFHNLLLVAALRRAERIVPGVRRFDAV